MRLCLRLPAPPPSLSPPSLPSKLQACCDLGSPETKLVVMVLNKGHNTRLFPEGKRQDEMTRTGNVRPGTVVEGLNDGAAGASLDFLLVAHR